MKWKDEGNFNYEFFKNSVGVGPEWIDLLYVGGGIEIGWLGETYYFVTEGLLSEIGDKICKGILNPWDLLRKENAIGFNFNF